MQVSWLFPIKMFDFFEYMQVWGLEVHQTCIYSKKINILIGKSHQTLIYSKKSKVLIVKSHQTLIYSKKIKKKQKFQTLCGTDWHRWISFWFFWFFWVYQGLVTFHYQNCWFFWVYQGLVTFPYQNVWFFWVYAGFVNLKSQTYIFATFEWYGFLQSIFLFQNLSN